MKFGIPENTIIKLGTVFGNYPEIEKVIIYGSRAKGNYRAALIIQFGMITQDFFSDMRH